MTADNPHVPCRYCGDQGRQQRSLTLDPRLCRVGACVPSGLPLSLRSDVVGWHVSRQGCLLGALPEGFDDLPLVRFPKALATYPVRCRGRLQRRRSPRFSLGAACLLDPRFYHVEACVPSGLPPESLDLIVSDGMCPVRVAS